MELLFEFSIIFVLLLANGIFSMAEIAVVSSRKNRLRAAADAGDKRARKALDLAESPNRFLSTVQVGITLVGIIAGAYGGASLSAKLAVILREVPGLEHYAHNLAFGIVVLLITYLSLVIGELVPKRIGLSAPERIAGFLAGPMNSISVFAKPLVFLLTASSNALMRLFGLKDAPEASITEDELRLLAREGLRAGVLQKTESEMVESVLALDKLQVKDIMTPRPKIIWIKQDEPHELIWHKIVVSGHSHFPVYESSRDQLAGVVNVKAIYAHLAANIPIRIKDLIVPPLFVPASVNALSLLETFKNEGKHVAIVIDEFGAVQGLVTTHDIMEAIVGEFPTMDARLRPTAKRRDDGSWLVDAMLPVDEFEAAVTDFPLHPKIERDYETFGGYIINRLGRVPEEGESFEAGPYVVEIIDMDHLRVDKVLLLPKIAGRTPPPGL
jgi:putative hemolysin